MLLDFVVGLVLEPAEQVMLGQRSPTFPVLQTDSSGGDRQWQ